MSIADLRREYRLATLTEAGVPANPFEQFGNWFNEALAAELPDANAMTLATVACPAQRVARPSTRIVLIRDFDERGFVFFTNYDSRKGRELAANPWASLLFHWTLLERQVRIDGRVEQVPSEQSDAYSPRGHWLAAWAPGLRRRVR
jgi:pyridoxamine 5'-phosphate oxidase